MVSYWIKICKVRTPKGKVYLVYNKIEVIPIRIRDFTTNSMTILKLVKRMLTQIKRWVTIDDTTRGKQMRITMSFAVDNGRISEILQGTLPTEITLYRN